MIPQPYPLTELEIKLPDLQQLVLTRGLPISIYRDEFSKAFVVIDWVFNWGYVDGRAELVPFVQRILFNNGIKSYSPTELREYVDFYGASLNLGVSANFSQLRLFVPSRYALRLLQLVRALLSEEVLVNPKQFASLKTRIVTQHAIQLEKNDYRATRELNRALHGIKSPYNRGYSLEDLQKVEEAEVLDFLNQLRGKLYHIFVAGKPSQSLVDRICQDFANKKPSSYPRAQAVPPMQITPYHKHLPAYIPEMKGNQVSIQMGRRIVHNEHADFWGLQILNIAFGGYFGSRLMQYIREEKGYTYGIYSNISSYLFHSNWRIRTKVNAEYRDLCIEDIGYCMRQLQTQAIQNEELQDVQNYLIKNTLKSIQNPIGVIHTYEQLALKRKDLRYFQQLVEYIRNIKSATLQSLAKKYLRPEDFVVITALG